MRARDANLLGVDGLVESAARGAAARLSRRSFLGRLGRAAVLLVAGPSIATLLADAAEGRVCGQTGVSPRCPTFDCDETWGWCWYATGCCAGGKLKKICDCCAPNWPNVHGYCPAGTNVKCIVESCGADPRVQRVGIETTPSDLGSVLALATIWQSPIDQGDLVVVADGTSQWHALVAEAAAYGVRMPSIRVGRDPLDDATIARISATRATTAAVMGPELPSRIDDQLREAGLRVERVATHPAIEPFSGEVAQWFERTVGPRDVVCVVREGVSGSMIWPAFRFARADRLPLVFGLETPLAGAGAYLVGPEAAARAGRTPWARTTASSQWPGIWNEMASWLMHRRPGIPIVLAPIDLPELLDALAMLGVPVVVHSPGNLDWAREWLYNHRHQATRVLVPSGVGRLDSGAVYELQSILNGFDAHLLTGTGGQGLPVYSQPDGERPVGLARGGDDPPPPPSYLSRPPSRTRGRSRPGRRTRRSRPATRRRP